MIAHEAELSAEQTAHDATRARLNELIVTEFEECTDSVIDPDDHFALILDAVSGPYAQTADEIKIASEKVAAAISLTCGHYFNDDVSTGVKQNAIASLVEKLKQPLEDAVNANIQAARTAHEVGLFNAGRGFQRFLNNFPQYVSGALTPNSSAP